MTPSTVPYKLLSPYGQRPRHGRLLRHRGVRVMRLPGPNLYFALLFAKPRGDSPALVSDFCSAQERSSRPIDREEQKYVSQGLEYVILQPTCSGTGVP